MLWTCLVVLCGLHSETEESYKVLDFVVVRLILLLYNETE